jgi:hypothetical protein
MTPSSIPLPRTPSIYRSQAQVPMAGSDEPLGRKAEADENGDPPVGADDHDVPEDLRVLLQPDHQFAFEVVALLLVTCDPLMDLTGRWV